MKTAFITYGTSEYALHKKHLLNLAHKSNFFDECYSFGPKDISPEFYKKHKEIFQFKKGGGYWIWKFQIIKQCLDQLKDGDVLIYSDSGSSLNKTGEVRLKNYIDMINSSNYSMIRFKIDYLEKYWTTKEIFDFFNISLDSEIANSNQYLAGHLIMKKTKSLIEQLEKFNELLEFNNLLITDKYDKNQISGFVQNRNDQSIFSLISKIYGCIELENEVWFRDNPNNQYEYPFLAVQQGKYSLYEKIKFYSNYKKHINSTIYFGEKIYSYQKPSLIKRVNFKINSYKD